MPPTSRSSSKRRRIETSSEELEEQPVTSPRKSRPRRSTAALAGGAASARSTTSFSSNSSGGEDDAEGEDEEDAEGEEEEEEDDEEREPELEHSHSASVEEDGAGEGEEEGEDAEWQEKVKIWEMFADEYHDIVEQLPLELQRSFQLMLEHDEQMRAHEKALENATIEYLTLAKSDAYQDAMIKAQLARKMAAHLGDSTNAPVHNLSTTTTTTVTLNGAHVQDLPAPIAAATYDVQQEDNARDIDAQGEAEERQEDQDGEGEVVDEDMHAADGSGEEAAAAMAELASAGSHNSEEDVQSALIKQINPPADLPVASAPASPPELNGFTTNAVATVTSGAETETEARNEKTKAEEEEEQQDEDYAAEQLRKLLGDIVTHSRAAIKAGEDKVALAVTAYDWVDRHIHRLDSDLMKHEEALALGLRPGTQPSTDAREALAHADENMLIGNMQGTPGTAGGGKGAMPYDLASVSTGGKKKAKNGKGKGKSASLFAPSSDPPLNLGSDDLPYCYCQRPSFGEMLGCDNDACPYQWFHMSCLGLTKAPSPTQSWYCPECREAMGRGKKKPAAQKPKKKSSLSRR